MGRRRDGKEGMIGVREGGWMGRWKWREYTKGKWARDVASENKNIKNSQGRKG